MQNVLLGSSPARTYGIGEYIGECGWYWVFMSVIHAAFFLIGILLIAAVSFYVRGHFRAWSRRWAIFNVCFFVTAGLTNGLWSCFIFGRFYWSTDYVFDFSPFWPIRQAVLDARFGDQVGGLLGITLSQLQGLWLGFAAFAWGSAIVLYYFCRDFKLPRFLTQCI